MANWVIRKRMEASYSKHKKTWFYLLKGKIKPYIWNNFYSSSDLHVFKTYDEAEERLELLKEVQRRRCVYEIKNLREIESR